MQVLCPARHARKTITKILSEVHQTALASGAPVTLGLRLAPLTSTIARSLILRAMRRIAKQGLTLPLEWRLARLVTWVRIKMMWASHLA